MRHHTQKPLSLWIKLAKRLRKTGPEKEKGKMLPMRRQEELVSVAPLKAVTHPSCAVGGTPDLTAGPSDEKWQWVWKGDVRGG